MKRYRPQKGDISRWSERKVEYVKVFDGQYWSQPIAVADVARADPGLYARVKRLDEEPDAYELVHCIKRIRKHYYREKAQQSPGSSTEPR